MIADDGEAPLLAPRSRRSRCPSCIPTSRSCCARWPATCSATKPRSRSTRRPVRCARRAAASRPRESARGAAGDDPLGVARRSSSSRCAARFFDGLRTGDYDGCLEAGTAVRLASLLRYATGVVPLDAYQIELGKVGTPSTVVEDLTAALTKAIEELTRPIDAIKHQAKTVTVGISRSDETLLQVPLVQEVLAAGTPRDSLTYRALRTLVALDPAVEAVVGLDPLRSTDRRATTITSSTAAASRATSRRAPTPTRCCAAPSTAPRPSARSPSCAGAPTAAR